MENTEINYKLIEYTIKIKKMKKESNKLCVNILN